MIFGLVVGALTLAPAAVLVLLDRRRARERAASVLLGGFGGAMAGAGVLLGGFFQPTTANIHSGYSFAGVLEWLLLAGVGAVLGALAGAGLGWLVPAWRTAPVALLLLAAAGAAGFVSSTRTTIDCDDRPSFCDDRYG